MKSVPGATSIAGEANVIAGYDRLQSPTGNYVRLQLLQDGHGGLGARLELKPSLQSLRQLLVHLQMTWNEVMPLFL